LFEYNFKMLSIVADSSDTYLLEMKSGHLRRNIHELNYLNYILNLTNLKPRGGDSHMKLTGMLVGKLELNP